MPLLSFEILNVRPEDIIILFYSQICLTKTSESHSDYLFFQIYLTVAIYTPPHIIIYNIGTPTSIKMESKNIFLFTYYIIGILGIIILYY